MSYKLRKFRSKYKQDKSINIGKHNINVAAEYWKCPVCGKRGVRMKGLPLFKHKKAVKGTLFRHQKISETTYCQLKE